MAKRKKNFVDGGKVAPVRIVVRGREVSFFRRSKAGSSVPLAERSADRIDCNPDFVVVHDVSGKIFRQCDVYVVPVIGKQEPQSQASDPPLIAAKKWFGDDAEVQGWRVDVPDSGWQRVAQIDAIWYRRDANDELRGPYEHRYDPPVELYRSGRGRNARYRIALPDRCVLDERGYVFP